MDILDDIHYKVDRIDDKVSKISQALIAIMTALTNAHSWGIIPQKILDKKDIENLNKEIQDLM